MNILEFKRKALGYSYRWSDRGTDSTGTGVGNTGGADSGGMGTNNGGGGDGFGMFGVTNTPQQTLRQEEIKAQDKVDKAFNDNFNAATKSFAQEWPNLSKALGYLAGLFGTAVTGNPLGGISAKALAEKVMNAPGLSEAQKASLNAEIADADQKGYFNPQGDSGESKFSQVVSAGMSGETSPGASTGTTEGLKDPITLATSIANQSWNDWQGDKKALQDRVAINAVRGDKLYDTSMQTVAGNLALSNQMQGDYNNIYRPAGQQYANYVNRLGTEAYRNEEAQRAMAGVRTQEDINNASMSRDLMRKNVNPASGRMLAMQNQNAISGAANIAGAGNQARRNAYTDWSNGLVKMSDMGNNTLSAAKGLDSSAQQWQTLGLNAGNTGFSQMTDLSKLGAANAASAGSVAGTAANALFGQAASNRADDAANPWTTIGGAVLTNAAKGIDWGNLFGSGFTSTPGMPSSTDEDPLEFLSGLGG